MRSSTRVGQLVSSEDFGDVACRLVFEAAVRLDAKGTAIDFVTVGQTFEERVQLARCGGTAFLVELAQRPGPMDPAC